MKKIVAGLFAATMLLAACGDDGGNNEPADNTNNAGGNANEEAANNEESGGEVDLANGEELYEGNCASCHGGDLSGGTGPALEGYSEDEIVSAIQEGPGSMPENLVEGQDAEDVAAWVADQN
ncbi:c-type cytochrome [Alkalicoccus daliensis]|uniref:Cytochrome c551 n=1 Tax=Alkalicoccus daliensis TaxID=745820 RepID=A0A1H0JQQ7_9BACI|nr:cytochrome c [Alkalicoccus daliensis]SDO45849.1 cytochrome c551 [Alkalicoccus daliensis]